MPPEMQWSSCHLWRSPPPQQPPHQRDALTKREPSPTRVRQKSLMVSRQKNNRPITGRHWSCEKSPISPGHKGPLEVSELKLLHTVLQRSPWTWTGCTLGAGKIKEKALKGWAVTALRKLLVTIYKWLAIDEKVSESELQMNSVPPQLRYINHPAGWLISLHQLKTQHKYWIKKLQPCSLVRAWFICKTHPNTKPAQRFSSTTLLNKNPSILPAYEGERGFCAGRVFSPALAAERREGRHLCASPSPLCCHVQTLLPLLLQPGEESNTEGEQSASPPRFPPLKTWGQSFCPSGGFQVAGCSREEDKGGRYLPGSTNAKGWLGGCMLGRTLAVACQLQLSKWALQDLITEHPDTALPGLNGGPKQASGTSC